jgi:Transport and Golgi organisation 2
VCTVIVRFTPGAEWPVLIGAVRDEFVERDWDPPGRHWGSTLIGGRDRTANGTWLAVDPPGRALAAVLNGERLPLPADGVRPSRGDLPLAALTGRRLPDGDELARYDGFHLVHATVDRVQVRSWDGVQLTAGDLTPGDHVIVNAGVDADTPLVERLLPGLTKLPPPEPRPGLPTDEAWNGWVELLGGDGIDPASESALIVARTFEGRSYGSTSASLVALSPTTVRYDFTATPGPAAEWIQCLK